MSSTALVLIYTGEGFVFAADGLEKSTQGRIIDTRACKIFPLCKRLAFSVAGFRAFHKAGSQEPSVEFPRIVRTAFKGISGPARREFFLLADHAAAKVNAQLRSLRERRIILRYHDDDGAGTIAKAFLAGYCKGIPRATIIRFFHSFQRLCTPEIVREDIDLGFFAYIGSQALWRSLERGDDARLQSYRCDAFDKMLSISGPNLKEAESVAYNFVLASCDRRIQLDFPECRSIGGRIQLATITPDAGFCWIIPPATQNR